MLHTHTPESLLLLGVLHIRRRRIVDCHPGVLEYFSIILRLRRRRNEPPGRSEDGGAQVEGTHGAGVPSGSGGVELGTVEAGEVGDVAEPQRGQRVGSAGVVGEVLQGNGNAHRGVRDVVLVAGGEGVEMAGGVRVAREDGDLVALGDAGYHSCLLQIQKVASGFIDVI